MVGMVLLYDRAVSPQAGTVTSFLQMVQLQAGTVLLLLGVVLSLTCMFLPQAGNIAQLAGLKL